MWRWVKVCEFNQDIKGIIGLHYNVNFDVIYAEKVPDLKSWLKFKFKFKMEHKLKCVHLQALGWLGL